MNGAIDCRLNHELLRLVNMGNQCLCHKRNRLGLLWAESLTASMVQLALRQRFWRIQSNLG